MGLTRTGALRTPARILSTRASPGPPGAGAKPPVWPDRALVRGFARSNPGYHAAMASPTEIGKMALSGWRKPVGERVAGPLSERTRLSSDQVEALVGAAFFALSLYYVASTAARAARAGRA